LHAAGCGITLTALHQRSNEPESTMQVAMNMKIERTETGEFIAYFPGDYHVGYGVTASDARDALMWSMENE
jgi:hypothetical protein